MYFFCEFCEWRSCEMRQLDGWMLYRLGSPPSRSSVIFCVLSLTLAHIFSKYAVEVGCMVF